MDNATSSQERVAAARYRLPAEWEHQRGILLTWPHSATDWRPYLGEIEALMVRLVAEIVRHESVVVAAQEPAAVTERLSSELGTALLHRVKIYPCRIDDTWARDHSVVTMLPVGGDGAPLLLDFRFNGWGGKYPSEHDDAINATLWRQGALVGALCDCRDFVLEGGSIESDGKGTVLTTSACLLAKGRNRPLTRAEIERQLKRRLCADRVLWLDHGAIEGDDTDGHIDTLARFAPGDTILYSAARADDDDAQAHALRLMEQELRSLRTADGSCYRLVALPVPAPVTYDGERLPATYTNYLVVNGAVLVPTYGDMAADRYALATIGAAFPDRETVAIDARVALRQHGSLHCLTMQMY